MQKVKEQIAQDRAEKTERFNREKNERDEKRKELEKEKLVEEARKAEQLLRERRFVLKLLISTISRRDIHIISVLLPGFNSNYPMEFLK